MNERATDWKRTLHQPLGATAMVLAVAALFARPVALAAAQGIPFPAGPGGMVYIWQPEESSEGKAQADPRLAVGTTTHAVAPHVALCFAPVPGSTRVAL